MPDAEITLYNKAMGVSRAMQSSLDGVFEFVGLPPAAGYRMRVSHERYVDWESEAFEVVAGRQTGFTIPLKPQNGDAPTASVMPPPQVDRTNSPVGASISEFQLETLPVTAHRWESLVLLAPAVRGGTAFHADFTDGLLTTNLYPGRPSAPAGRLAQDAVQGVEVLSAAAPVEFGHALGGVVNVVTRSGGNGLHGRVYDYFSNDSLNAMDRYALGNELFGKRHQLGFNLGGRIPRSKLFFFSNLEILDANGQRLNRITNPLIADSTGSRVAASNCTATAAQCSAATRFIESQMDRLVPASEHAVSGVFKLDYRPSDRNNLSLAAYATRLRSPLGSYASVAPNGGLLGDALFRQETHYGKLEWVSAPSPTSSNELRLGLFHDKLSSGASNSGLSTGKASIFVAGAQVGEAYADASVIRERRFQLVDHFRASAGAHTFLVGMDWTRTQDWIGGLSNASGAYYYPSLTAFAKDLSGSGQKNYSYFSQTLGNPVRKLNTPELGVYLQDSWNVSPRLRVTAGVRWSKQFLPQPTEQDSYYYQSGKLRSPNINADPRVGVSYLIDDRTVVRGSFGMFHAPHSGELIDALFLGNGVYQSSLLVNPSQTGSPLFPAAVASIPTGSLNVMYAVSKLRNPYTRQTSFSIERYVGSGLTVTAGYVGSRGVMLWTAEDLNLGPTGTATYTINDAVGVKAGTFETPIWTSRASTDYAHVYEVTNGGSSWYRAMVLQLRKRMSHGFSAQASYTWSHAIDNVGGELIAGSLPVSTYNKDYGADRGSSSYDQRHRAVFDWTWQPRPVRSDSPAARYLLNGWEISSIATLASSQPATALVLVAGQQFSGVTTAFAGSLNGSGGWSRVPFLPVNHLNGEPEYTFNARLARPIPFSERITGRLTFEAFNLFNSQFNTGVNTLAYTAAGGVLTPVSGLGAGNSARGYVTGSNARSCQVAFRLDF